MTTESYVVRKPWGGGVAEHGGKLLEAYEAGGLLVFDDVPLAGDVPFLQSVAVKYEKGNNVLKKAKLGELLKPISPQHLLCRGFKLDPEKANHFRKQVGLITAQVTGFAAQLFPTYRLGKTSHTWRFAPTPAEGLHLDSYGDDVAEVAWLRVFVNVDSEDRVWRAGPRSWELYDRYWDSCKLAQHAHLAPNLFNGAVNRTIPWAEVEATEVRFKPLTMWIGDTQHISHEIVSGRRVLAYTFGVPLSDWRRPELTFVNRTNDYLRRRQGGRA